MCTFAAQNKLPFIMKRQKIYFIAALILTILAIMAIVYKKGGFQKSQNLKKLSTIFAIKDTETVTKIFMADMFGEKVLLSKTEAGWLVDQDKPAADYKINNLLATLSSIQIAQPISKQMQPVIIEMLAVESVKVEVYANQPLFTIFGKPFFTKERLIKTYFFGDATPTSLGSYASLQGMSEPYVIAKPGFRGYVSPIFSPKPIDWFSHKIFSTKLTQIQKASFVDFEHPENSFFVEKAGPRNFSLFDSHNNLVKEYDTTLLINMLSEFRERNYELFLQKMTQAERDSIIQSKIFKTISIVDVDNQTTIMNLYHQIDSGSLYEDGKLIKEVHYENNKDRCYAIMNNNTGEIFTVQFFHFDRQIQPLSYYLYK